MKVSGLAALTEMEEQMLESLKALNTIRKEFRAKAKRLKRQVTRLDLQNLEDTENSYKELEAEVKRFYKNLELWEDTLPVNEDGDIIYPEAEDLEAGADFNPEKAKIWLSNFQKGLHEVRKEFVKFKSRECEAVQISIAEEATLKFIKDTPIEAAIMKDLMAEEDKEEFKPKEKDENSHVDHEAHDCRID